MQSNTNNLSIVALIGGPNDPSGNNAYVFALNYQGPANPGTTEDFRKDFRNA